MLPLRSVGPEGVRRRMVIGQRSHGHRPSRWRPWPRRSCDLPCTLARSHPPACYRHESQAHLGRGERHDEPGEQRPQAQGRGRRPPAAGEAQPLHFHCLVPSTCPPPMAMAMNMTMTTTALPTDDGPAMNASAARSSATARRPASAAATSALSACTRQTAATTSRSPSMRPRTHATRHG
jgi:hypothetical protein